MRNRFVLLQNATFTWIIVTFVQNFSLLIFWSGFFLHRVNIYLSAGGGGLIPCLIRVQNFCIFFSASTHIKISCSSKHENYDSLLPGRPISLFSPSIFPLYCVRHINPSKSAFAGFFCIFGITSKGMGTKLFNTIILSKKINGKKP